jgi:hypothetical protein
MDRWGRILQVNELKLEQCVTFWTGPWSRVNVTREQMAKLLPHLTRFVETGEAFVVNGPAEAAGAGEATDER